MAPLDLLRATLEQVPGTYLVGGMVRDLLLGRAPGPDADVVALGTGPRDALLGRLGGEPVRHDRFGTVAVRLEWGVVDVALARRETYPAPGALPVVEFTASLEEDLARRDFTVNAIALASGEPVAHPGALDDLAARRLRVLHAGSFRDDPTRLWRLVRYAVRLGFLPSERTQELAVEAVHEGAPATVSPARLGAELRRALTEPDPLAVLQAAQGLGLVEGLTLDPALTAAAGSLLPAGEGSPGLLVLGSVVPDGQWVAGRGLTGDEERVVRRCAELAPIPPGASGSQLARALRGEPVEAVAVAGARGDVRGALRWLSELRHVQLEIGGQDLLAAGVPAGPEVGRRLTAALEAKLDGRAPDRASELAEALRA